MSLSLAPTSRKVTQWGAAKGKPVVILTKTPRNTRRLAIGQTTLPPVNPATCLWRMSRLDQGRGGPAMTTKDQIKDTGIAARQRMALPTAAKKHECQWKMSTLGRVTATMVGKHLRGGRRNLSVDKASAMLLLQKATLKKHFPQWTPAEVSWWFKLKLYLNTTLKCSHSMYR